MQSQAAVLKVPYQSLTHQVPILLHVGSNLCHWAKAINTFSPNVLRVTKFGMFSLKMLIKVSTARKVRANMQLILSKNLYLKSKLLNPQLQKIMLRVCS